MQRATHIGLNLSRGQTDGQRPLRRGDARGAIKGGIRRCRDLASRSFTLGAARSQRPPAGFPRPIVARAVNLPATSAGHQSRPT